MVRLDVGVVCCIVCVFLRRWLFALVACVIVVVESRLSEEELCAGWAFEPVDVGEYFRWK